MLANVITSCRIILSVTMLFFPTFSIAFHSLYLVAGFTDTIDGAIARKLGTNSEFGAKLDTVADIVFVAIAAFKLLPLIEITKVIWFWILLIAVIKAGNLIFGFVTQKQFVAIHTIANKITGFILFILPLTLPVVNFRYSSIAVCIMATFAALQEGYIVLFNFKQAKAGH
ncbi:MAG: CDP-alcohol phosphatidyltransferase family protein [Lachnospira sp.]